MRETFNLLCFEGVLLRDNLLMGAFCPCDVTYITDLLTHAYSGLATGLSRPCSTSKRVSLSSVFLFLNVLFNYMCCHWSFNPACRMTVAEDIDSYSILNRDWQLSKSLYHCRHARKNLSSFCFCVSKIPWLNVNYT